MKLSEIIYLKGHSVFSFPYKIHYIERGEKEARTIISVPKKNFKRAVKRNLIRRRIKESLRLNRQNYPSLEAYHILIIYVAKEILDYESIKEGLKEAIGKIS